MVLRGALVVLALAGCDRVYGLDTPPPCDPPAVFDDFDGDALCGTWGRAGGGNREMAQGDGTLTITPAPDTQGHGTCTTNAPIFLGPSGMFLELAEVLPQAISYTNLVLTWPELVLTRKVALSLQFGVLTFEVDDVDLGQTTFDPDLTRWWRIRPDVDHVVGETSPDGVTWTTVGVTGPLAVPDAVHVELVAGIFDPSPMPGRAVFEGFNVCPR